ncbi:LemA family protein [Limosilactobacillus fermentum]|uniref:LemA family protein n=1 Tax=Limosilactobacillus fermentum TaxID=1613 RepID=UPI0006855CD8|nr:LemA family protein [Limosilactobacillus fermentum]
MYNGLQTSKVHVEETWSQIDVQLKRRNDLIPNLVSTTKGYAKHEQETFAQIVKLRNQLTQLPADAHQERMDVSNQLAGTLKTIFALSENYPDLKANTDFLQLQEELTNTENKISCSRQLYNSCVADFDRKLVTIPTSIVAKMSHMTKIEYLATPETGKAVPKVEF